MFIKTITKGSRKVKRIRNYLSNSNLYVYFLMQQNLLISGEKMLMSAELKECVTSFIHFFSLPQVSFNCAKFHHCRICVAGFREGDKKAPANPRAGPKKPILNRVSLYVVEPGKKSMMLYFIHLVKLFFSILYILTQFSTLLDLLEITVFALLAPPGAFLIL